MEYREIQCKIPSALADTACDLAQLTDIGGIYLEDYSDLSECALVQQISLIEPELLAKDKTTAVLHLYYDLAADPAEKIGRLSSLFESAGISCAFRDSTVDDSEWINGWKKYYHKMEIGKLTIVPSWEDKAVRDGQTPLVIDPGLAFGTGSHETTSLCLESLQNYPLGRVLDVGCGSGILSIGALLCGAEEAKGIDIDPNAAKIAPENAALNPEIADRFQAVCGNILDRTDPVLPAFLGNQPFDTVLANIVADVIIPLSGGLNGILKPEGLFICSGILTQRENEVVKALKENGYDILERKQKKEWRCFICRKH